MLISALCSLAQGGNVEGSVADQTVEKNGVKVIGFSNTATHLAADASALYSRNLYNFLSAFWDKEQGEPILDEEIGIFVLVVFHRHFVFVPGVVIICFLGLSVFVICCNGCHTESAASPTQRLPAVGFPWSRS